MFKKAQRNTRLSFDELSTLLTGVESTTKSRPLTYKYNDIEEVSTPSHVLWGRDFRQLVFVIEVPKNPQGMSPVDAWKKSELMLDSLSSQGGMCCHNLVSVLRDTLSFNLVIKLRV